MIPIGLPGQTKLPKTLDEFNVMSCNSQYPNHPFQSWVAKFNSSHSQHISLSEPQNDIVMDLSQENESDTSGENIYLKQRCDSLSETSKNVVDGIVQSDDDSSTFSFSDDSSRYTLDCAGNISERERETDGTCN